MFYLIGKSVEVIQNFKTLLWFDYSVKKHILLKLRIYSIFLYVLENLF